MIIVFLFFILFLSNMSLWAVPAYPNRIKVKTEKGLVYINMRGDENCKYAISEDGYTILQDSTGWYFACINEKGEIQKSSHQLQPISRMDAKTKSYLATLPKGLCPASESRSEALIKHSDSSVMTRTDKKTVLGDRRVLIILMEFVDKPFKKTNTDFYNLFNQPGYSEDGAYGSVYDYYQTVSYGQLNLQCDIMGPYKTNYNMAYYGGNTSTNGNDRNPFALFEEAIRHASREVNLADYDVDKDGYIDNIHIIYSGYGEEAGASANSIWAHEMQFETYSIDNMKIDCYSCSPELRGNSGSGITRIGVPCHEIGHALGANDFYDVNYQVGGYYEGTGTWDIMASGSWNDEGARPADFNPYVKAYNFGWVSPVEILSDTILSVSPSRLSGNVYRINTSVEGDYFLIENRQSEGITDAEPGKGLLIYHIGPDIEKKSVTNTINSSYPQQCYIVCASSAKSRPNATPSSYGNISSDGCPFPGSLNNTAFTSLSIPSSYCINGEQSYVSITNISLNDSYITFLYEKETNNEGELDVPSDEEANIERIWSDDFEGFNLASSWINENIQGKSSWKHTYTFETPTDKRPNAVSGYGYISLEPETGFSMGGVEQKIINRLITSLISLDSKMKYTLTGYYRIYDTNKLPTDTLKILFRSSESYSWNNIETYTTLNRNQWKKFSIEFSDYKSVQIGFEGVVNSNALIFLDNIVITRNCMSNSVKDENMTLPYFDIYTINATFIGRKRISDLTNMPSGIYILRNKNEIRKIVR